MKSLVSNVLIAIIEKVKGIQRHSTIFIILLGILVLAGMAPSIVCSDWTWFSRSGSLVVIFGVFIVWLDYKGGIDEALDNVLSGYKEHLQNSEDLTEEQKEKFGKEVQEKFGEVSVLNEKRFQNIEFYVIALGTLIWGYGDLLGELPKCI